MREVEEKEANNSLQHINENHLFVRNQTDRWVRL